MISQTTLKFGPQHDFVETVKPYAHGDRLMTRFGRVVVTHVDADACGRPVLCCLKLEDPNIGGTCVVLPHKNEIDYRYS